MSMFAKAVEQKRNAEPKKPATLEQKLFPSSSPAGSQPTSRPNLQRFRYTPNVLQPSSSAAHNVVPKPGLPSATLKRTSTEAGMNCECPAKYHRSGSCERIAKRALSTVGQSAVSRLHQNVEFDENSADDMTVVQASRSASDQTVTYPDLSQHQGFTSSATVPWSSSPPEHLQPKLYPDLSTHRADPPQSRIGAGTVTEFGTKRRKLPWMEKKDNDVDDQPGGTSFYVERTTNQTRRKGDSRNTVFNTNTPHTFKQPRSSKTKAERFSTPSGPIKSPYVWDKTASAIKNEQKQIRLAAKKQQLVKTFENNDPDVKAKVVEDIKRKNPAKVFLSEEQQSVLKLVVGEKSSVFFTGSAGTGKSVLLREIIRSLRDVYSREPERVAVTASTGLAACNIGGVTLHSFAGIGLGKEPVEELVKKIRRNAKAKNRWMRVKVIVVDEISMVDGELFDKLEAIARIIRNNGRQFGGIQLVVTGDFFQLPPVPDSGRAAKFAFDAMTWNTSIDHTIGLTQVFRQKDPIFANILNEMRLGRISPTSLATFRKLSRPLDFHDDFEATELFPTRNEVEAANNQRMRNLGGTSMEFVALDGGLLTDLSQRDKLLSNCMAPQRITLKKGAQVMLIKNIDETLVNGSLGRVVAFMDEKTFDIYHEDEDEFQSGGTQDPASRGRSKLKDLMNTQGNIGSNASTAKQWPLVRFHIADGTTRDLLCQHESWKIELPNGEVQASRNQIPLILAWALSIHKAQGQTLERVKVDLGKIFEKGQAYVALSRATCQEGLQVLRFDARKVMAHDKVKTFYNGLYNVQSPPTLEEPPPDKPGIKTKLYDVDDDEAAFLHEAEMASKGKNRRYNVVDETAFPEIKPVFQVPHSRWIVPKPQPKLDEFEDDFLDDADVLAEMNRVENGR